MHAKSSKLKKALLVIVILLAAVCIAGAIWNAAATSMEAKEYPPEGQLVDVFDTQMHVLAKGTRTTGSPAVVLIAGHATPSPTADYYPLWSRLEEGCQVVVLERSGYGWSGDTQRDRTVMNIVEEDRRALEQAGIAPPYILVAHSMGGIEANVFANQCPDDVQGIVLIDSTSPELTLAFPNSPSLRDRIITPLRHIGGLRFLNAVAPNLLQEQSQGYRNGFQMVPAPYRQLDMVCVLQKYQDSMMIQEYEQRQANAETALSMPFPSDIPVLLLMADYGEPLAPEDEKYMDMQEAWVSQSTNGKLEKMEGGHYLHQFNPEEVCAAVLEMATSN